MITVKLLDRKVNKFYTINPTIIPFIRTKVVVVVSYARVVVCSSVMYVITYA